MKKIIWIFVRLESTEYSNSNTHLISPPNYDKGFMIAQAIEEMPWITRQLTEKTSELSKLNRVEMRILVKLVSNNFWVPHNKYFFIS